MFASEIEESNAPNTTFSAMLMKEKGGGRVKSKKEIRILYDASEEKLIRQFLQYERTHRFLPRLGIILPCTRAISCQGEVKYEKRTLWQQVLG